jgi:hypothetical protein
MFVKSLFTPHVGLMYRLLGHLLQLGKFGRILYWKNGIHQKDQMGFGGLVRPILVHVVKCKY